LSSIRRSHNICAYALVMGGAVESNDDDAADAEAEQRDDEGYMEKGATK